MFFIYFYSDYVSQFITGDTLLSYQIKNNLFDLHFLNKVNRSSESIQIVGQ